MPEDKKNKITVYVPDSLLWPLRQKALSERITGDTGAIERAAQVYVNDVVSGNPQVAMLVDAYLRGDKLLRLQLEGAINDWRKKLAEQAAEAAKVNESKTTGKGKHEIKGSGTHG